LNAEYADIPGTLGRFLGFWAVLTQAAFSYIGTEIVAIAAGEAKNPRKSLSSAIKKVYIRILVFYLGGTFIIVSWFPVRMPPGASTIPGRFEEVQGVSSHVAW
jgi:amino acid transporter